MYFFREHLQKSQLITDCVRTVYECNKLYFMCMYTRIFYLYKTTIYLCRRIILLFCNNLFYNYCALDQSRFWFHANFILIFYIFEHIRFIYLLILVQIIDYNYIYTYISLIVCRFTYGPYLENYVLWIFIQFFVDRHYGWLTRGMT